MIEERKERKGKDLEWAKNVEGKGKNRMKEKKGKNERKRKGERVRKKEKGEYKREKKGKGKRGKKEKQRKKKKLHLRIEHRKENVRGKETSMGGSNQGPSGSEAALNIQLNTKSS